MHGLIRYLGERLLTFAISFALAAVGFYVAFQARGYVDRAIDYVWASPAPASRQPPPLPAGWKYLPAEPEPHPPASGR
jgi:hypothetical protein